MPLDPSIFYNFAALRQNQAQNTQAQIGNAIDSYREQKRYEQERAKQGLDLDALTQKAAIEYATTGQVSPEGLAAIKAKSLLEGQKVSMQQMPDGSFRQIAMPTLWDRFQEMGGGGQYKPAFPPIAEMGVTAPVIPVDRQPMAAMPGMDGQNFPSIDMAQLDAPVGRGSTMPPPALTPQQAAALEARGNLFATEAPPLPQSPTEIPVRIGSLPGQGPKTGQKIQESNVDLQQKAIELEMQKQKELDIKRQEPMNLEQGKVATFSDRLLDANKQLEDLVSAQTSLYNRGASGVPIFGNYLTDSDYQKAAQAERNFINAVLRRESGAVISEEEFANARQQYFPQPGDTEAVIQQKEQNRRTVIDGFTREAGPQYKPKVSLPPSGSKKIGTSGGKAVYQLPDGSYIKEK